MNPSAMDYLTLLISLLLASAVVRLLRSTFTKYTSPNPSLLPPGPTPLPFFGNVFSLSTKPHIAWTHLAKTYGPVMTIHLGRVVTVVISSADLAKQALQKKDLFFSNRRVIDAVCAINHDQNSLAFLSVCHKWRTLRKICNTQVFCSTRLDATKCIRKNKVSQLMSYVRKKCDAGQVVDIGDVAFSTTLNLLSTTFFSVDVCDLSSEIHSEFKETVRKIAHEMGKPNLVDYFPVLRRMDPQGIWRRTGAHFGKMIRFFDDIIEQRLKQGRTTSCSTRDKDNDVLDALLGFDNQGTHDKIEPYEISHLLLELFTAGADTTSTTLEWAMAELLRNPEKLRKAQTELHEIIGKDNSIEETDMKRLPYLQAIIKETCRLHPPAPFLLPRLVDSNVQLSHFTIPKNAQVLVNVWAIGRDPSTWDNPDLFQPERFLDSNVDLKGRDFELIPFGAGRRICPGLPLATQVLHLMVGSLVHGFNWKLEKETDMDTNINTNMDMEGEFGFTLRKANPLCAIPFPHAMVPL